MIRTQRRGTNQLLVLRAGAPGRQGMVEQELKALARAEHTPEQAVKRVWSGNDPREDKKQGRES